MCVGNYGLTYMYQVSIAYDSNNKMAYTIG